MLCGRYPGEFLVLAIFVLHLAGCSAMDRLPSTVTPLNYMLRLEPDLNNNTVSGVVMIELITTSKEVSTHTSILLTTVSWFIGYQKKLYSACLKFNLFIHFLVLKPFKNYEI